MKPTSPLQRTNGRAYPSSAEPQVAGSVHLDSGNRNTPSPGDFFFVTETPYEKVVRIIDERMAVYRLGFDEKHFPRLSSKLKAAMLGDLIPLAIRLFSERAVELSPIPKDPDEINIMKWRILKGLDYNFPQATALETELAVYGAQLLHEKKRLLGQESS